MTDDIDSVLAENLDLSGDINDSGKIDVTQKAIERGMRDVAAKDVAALTLGNIFAAFTLILMPIITLFVSRRN